MKVNSEKYLIQPDDGFIDIKGYEGRYQIHNDGTVRRLLCGGYARNLSPWGRRRNVYCLSKDGVRNNHTVGTLFCLAYGIKIPDGYVLIHKNGIITDNDFYNFGVATKRYSYLSGGNGEVPVFKIEQKTKKIVKQYKSIREAARANGIDRNIVSKLCRGINKSTTLLKGYTFMYVRDYYKSVDDLMGY